jgi:hypothetical protein
MNITINIAWFLLTALSNLYKTRTNHIWPSCTIRELTILKRNSDSEAMILLAVAAVSPGTIREEADITPITANGAISRYSNPASLAVLLGFIFSVVVIVFSPF